MMLLIDEKLYLNFVEKYGEEKAEKLDEVVCELCSFPTEKVQRILGVDYDEVMNIYSQIQDTRDKQVLKMLRQIAKNEFFDENDLHGLKYIEYYEPLVLCYFATEMGAINKICGKKYKILDKEKFLFLAKFLWLDNKHLTLEKWKKMH